MKIVEITENKSGLMPLLLIGDEQEEMVLCYLEKCRVFALYDPDLRAVCAVLPQGKGVLEIKNIAVFPRWQRMGYGRKLIEFIEKQAKPSYYTLLVGTGESPLTLPFYEKCGFVYSHRIAEFFTENYDHPIIEGGVLLRDMVYLKKDL